MGSRHLTVGEVVAIHAAIFGIDHRQARDRLRDSAGLESAINRSRFREHYGGTDLADQAASLAHGIAEGQCFVDGNKRTALIAMTSFLDANNAEINVPDARLAEWLLDLSRGLSADAFAIRLRPALRHITGRGRSGL
jgi:death-on-curing protein